MNRLALAIGIDALASHRDDAIGILRQLERDRACILANLGRARVTAALTVAAIAAAVATVVTVGTGRAGASGHDERGEWLDSSSWTISAPGIPASR